MELNTNVGVSTGKKRWKPGKKTWFAVLAVALGGGVFYWLSAGSEPTAPAMVNPSSGPKQVRVEEIRKQKIGDPPEYVAEVVPYSQVDVMVKANGNVVELLKQRGDFVEKDEVLFVIDPEQALWAEQRARLSLESAIDQQESTVLDLQSALLKLEQQVEEALKQWNRLRNEYDMGLATEKQVEQAQNQYEALSADLKATREKLHSLQQGTQVEMAKIALQEAEKNLENHYVKAPISGVLTDFNVEEGMFLSAGVSAGHIQQINPIKIKAELTDTARNLISPEATELEFYIPGVVERQKGKIAYLADVMNATNKTYTLELEVPNPQLQLKPGMRAQVLLTSEEEQQVLAIPTTSVIREGADTFVFVHKDGEVEKRQVKLGRLNGTLLEVLSGVKEGEQVVVSGQFQLKDGEQVQLVN